MKQKQAALLIKDKQIIISRLDKGDLHSNLALCLVLKILFPSLLNHVLCTSLHVPAVELVILVKPIGIFTHVLMNIFFGTKIHVFKHLNCSRHCRDSCDASSFKIIDCANNKNHIEQLNPELNKQVEHVNSSLHF